MHNLLAAIVTATTSSALSTDVGGRIYCDEAPEQSAYPHVVFRILGSRPEDTFTEGLEETQIEFVLRSTSDGLTEITTMYSHLQTLFDDATLTVTGGTNVLTERQNLYTVMEDVTTPAGTVGCRTWYVEYRIMVQA